MLTNGVQDFVFATRLLNDTARSGNQFIGGGSDGDREPGFLFRRPRDTQPYDLAGNEITAITLRHDAFTVTPRTATGVAVAGSFTIVFEGHPVPEPGAAALVLPGLLMQTRRRARRQGP